MSADLFETYRAAIAQLPAGRALGPDDLWTDDFLLARNGDVECFYAPFDHVEVSATVAIVGVTPGWMSMEIAFREAREALRDGCADEEILRRAKLAAAFPGPMRARLVAWLDRLGLQRHLGLAASADLFDGARRLLEPAHLLRYPVFVRRKNYSGQSPRILATNGLRESVEKWFLPELGKLDRPLVIPLGPRVSEVISHYEGALAGITCLHGFPHPSGLNALGPGQFAGEERRLRREVAIWAARRGRETGIPGRPSDPLGSTPGPSAPSSRS
jgi:hypothetical protein